MPLQKAYMRMRPTFLIIGAQRCGTTSLYNYLAAHPCIGAAVRKEIHFFDKNFSKGYHWYKTFFPSCIQKYYQKIALQKPFITGEASPYYIFHPLAARRIFYILPQIKLIILLRNPVDRAYSHYQHMLRKGYEQLSFEDAIAAEPERLEGEKEKICCQENYHSFAYQNYSYLSRGIYIEQVKHWMKNFPRTQFFIINSESFYMSPNLILQQIFGFLGIPGWNSQNYKAYNQFNYPKMNGFIRKQLIAYFEPYNQELYAYLGANYGWNR